MPKIKYVGPGLTAIGVDFVNGRVYELSDKAAQYVLSTFPNYFFEDGKVVTPVVEEPAPDVIDEPVEVVMEPTEVPVKKSRK